MRAAGWVMVVTGAGLAMRSALLLAGRGRPQRGPRPPFVIAGPYRRVRNPLFAGLVIATAGLALARTSWACAALALVLGALAHWWVVRIEEPDLRTRFGAAYTEYVRRIPRWLPSFAADDERDR